MYICFRWECKELNCITYLNFAKVNKADFFFLIKLKEPQKEGKNPVFRGCIYWGDLIAVISKYMYFLL